MALPVNISELVNGNTIEWERLEFKQGWNPEDVIHTMCSFANDIHNWGGGYIIIGIAEKGGKPILPPAGIPQMHMDALQGEVIKLAHRLSPTYFPITAPYIFESQHILVLWCPAGDNRPYTAPSTLGAGSVRQYYIRLGSRNIIAKNDSLKKLHAIASNIPFDDRINNLANLNDLDLGLIRDFLQEIKSSLFDHSASMLFPDLCRSMFIAKGPNEDIRPINVGLLFFSLHPERFFSRAWIELVWHSDSQTRNFKEMYFKGPLHKQLRDALSFIKSNVLMEYVVKTSFKAEADRFFNFPFEAIEEVLSNAVYHKSYEQSAPIEIQIFPEKLTILSYPGPVPPVNAKILSSQKRIIAREYRNRRIGDFLKELHLTEGRGTGFPTIYDSMSANGSPEPIFETDGKSYVLVTLPSRINSSSEVKKIFESNQVGNQESNQEKILFFNTIQDLNTYAIQGSNQENNQVSNEIKNKVANIIEQELGNYAAAILHYIHTGAKSSTAIMHQIGLSKQSKNTKKHINPLIDIGWIKFTEPKNLKDRNQKYILTEAGNCIVKLIS